MKGICVNIVSSVLYSITHYCCQSGPVFPIPQGMLPWQPILCRSGLVRSEPKYLRIRGLVGSRFFFNFWWVEVDSGSTQLPIGKMESVELIRWGLRAGIV